MTEQINELDLVWFRKKDSLISEAEQAISWGTPDRESTGYSSSEFISIISKLVKRIKELENEQLCSKAP